MSNRRRRRRSVEVTYPFCGESEEPDVDLGRGTPQLHAEDCAICCRPRGVHVEASAIEGQVQGWLERGD